MFITALLVMSMQWSNIELQIAPQVTCPLSMDEYISKYKWWAQKEILINNRIRAPQLFKQVNGNLWECATCGKDFYVGKDRRWHVGWWTVA